MGVTHGIVFFPNLVSVTIEKLIGYQKAVVLFHKYILTSRLNQILKSNYNEKTRVIYNRSSS